MNAIMTFLFYKHYCTNVDVFFKQKTTKKQENIVLSLICTCQECNPFTLTLNDLAQLQVCTYADSGSPIKLMYLEKENHAYPHDWILNSWEKSALENLQPSQLEAISSR